MAIAMKITSSGGGVRLVVTEPEYAFNHFNQGDHVNIFPGQYTEPMDLNTVWKLMHDTDISS